MENKKDIGKAFREKLDRLDRTAPASGWSAFSGELQQMKMQRRFPWKRVVGLSLLMLLIGLFATYPFWKNDVPHVYIEMPEEHESHRDTKAAQAPDADGTEKTASSEIQKIQDDGTATVTPVSNENTSNADFKKNNPPTENGAVGIVPENHLKGETKKTAAPKPLMETPEPQKAAHVEKPATVTDDSEGKFKTLDLSKVNYGSDSLKIKKDKKLDTRRIADSLNKLYGRERPAKQKKKTE